MHSQQHTSKESLAWYRYPMVWMVILLPALVVVASMFTIVIAHQNAPQLIPAQTHNQTVDKTGKH